MSKLGLLSFLFVLHLLNTPWHSPPHPWRPQTWGSDTWTRTCQRFWLDKPTVDADKNTRYVALVYNSACASRQAFYETIMVSKEQKKKSNKNRKDRTRTDTTSNHQRKLIFIWFCLDKVDTPSKPTNDLSISRGLWHSNAACLLLWQISVRSFKTAQKNNNIYKKKDLRKRTRTHNHQNFWCIPHANAALGHSCAGWTLAWLRWLSLLPRQQRWVRPASLREELFSGGWRNIWDVLIHF